MDPGQRAQEEQELGRRPLVPSRTGPWSEEHDGRHHHVGRRLRALRRTPDNRVLGGVCGGISRATGIDAMWVRIGFVLLAMAVA